ncbi:hypothetical protein [Adhaeribacter pallidiroseus]
MKECAALVLEILQDKKQR